MTERLSPSDRSELDAAVRAAVAADRDRLCGDLPQVRKTKDGYPRYEGGYLGLGNLSYLVAQKMLTWSALTEWSEDVLHRALRPDRSDKALPLDLRERQLLLEALESTLADC